MVLTPPALARPEQNSRGRSIHLFALPWPTSPLSDRTTAHGCVAGRWTVKSGGWRRPWLQKTRRGSARSSEGPKNQRGVAVAVGMATGLLASCASVAVLVQGRLFDKAIEAGKEWVLKHAGESSLRPRAHYPATLCKGLEENQGKGAANAGGPALGSCPLWHSLCKRGGGRLLTSCHCVQSEPVWAGV